MNILLFALKRTVKNPSFMVLLAVCTAAIFAASLSGAAGEYPPAGVYCGDDSAAAQRIVDYLTGNGFILCEDEQYLLEQVECGALDCGVVLPEGLSRLIEEGGTDGCVEFISGPLSFSPQLYQSHAAAALYRECAPYIAARVLEELPRQELLEEYERRFQSGYVFSFEVLSVDGTAPRESGEPALMMGAAALLLFALLTGAGVDSIGTDLLLRLGTGKTLRAVLLPGVLVRGVLAAAAGSAGLLLADAAHLIVPLGAYTLVLSALGILLAAVLPEQRDRYILLAVVLIASLALCPIFADLTLFSPLLRWVRCVLPPYWFYLAAENRGAWLAVGCAAMVLACCVMCARWYLVDRFTISEKFGRTGETV